MYFSQSLDKEKGSTSTRLKSFEEAQSPTPKMPVTKEDVDLVIASMEQMAKEMQSLTLENKVMKEKLNMVSSDVKFYDTATGVVQIKSSHKLCHRVKHILYMFVY